MLSRLHSSGDQLLCIGVQYMFTLDLTCMQYLCVHNPPNYDTDYRIFKCLRDLLMHAYTHFCLYWYWMAAFFWGGGGGGLRSLFFILEGPWAPFYEILKATLRMVQCLSLYQGLGSSKWVTSRHVHVHFAVETLCCLSVLFLAFMLVSDASMSCRVQFQKNLRCLVIFHFKVSIPKFANILLIIGLFGC